MNSELYDKTYEIPSQTLKHIQAVLVSHPTGDGVKRAKNMLKSGVITYQGLKRLKNFFDYYNPQNDGKLQYELAGGDSMKSFVESKLNSERDGVSRSKRIKAEFGADTNSSVKAQKPPRLNETFSDIKVNAIAVIVNNDNKILLLKRSPHPNQWCPNKWSLVGGAVEDGELVKDACEREVEEETGLKVNNLIKKYEIQRNPDSIEHIFICRYDGDPTNITLNDENVGFGWYSPVEFKFLDTVPNLSDYVNLAFKKYD